MQLDDFLARLDDVKKQGVGYVARCLAHEDKHPSLSVSSGDGGGILVLCRAGCTTEQVVASLGLNLSDLFPKMGKVIPFNRPGFSLAQYAEAKKLPVDFLQSLELATVKYQNAEAVRIPYLDANGELAAVRYRLALSGDDRFRWRSGTKPCLYGLWRLNPKPDYIVLVEGESDCHTLWFHNIPAVGVPGAANWREERDAPHLDGIPIIYVIVEPDRGGEAVKKWLGRSAIRDRVRLVSLGEYKDPSGLYLADPEHFQARFQAALDAATLWTDQAEQEAAAQHQEAWEKCQDLAQQEKILDTFADTLYRSGVVGVRKFAQLIFLILITRLL